MSRFILVVGALLPCAVFAGSSQVDFPQGPLPATAKIGWAHAPYEDGDCSICHERKDPKNVGKIILPVVELCESCHEEYIAVLARPHTHKPAKKSCVNCHNAHNAVEKKLLHAALPRLCEECHDETVKEMSTLKVKHLAVEQGKKCLNCHNPHGANYERLLIKAPFDLCSSCHTADDVKDGSGKVLANIGKLVAEAKTLHKPVADKDCSACHAPHASANFRLLNDPYPAEFYASFDPKNYALCFECHKPEIVLTKETTTLTRFRDGPRNLHFVHVNKEERGRTCRACHEVHAANQLHLIRDSVPFGPKGWLLKSNFRPTPTGGTCDKTCHAMKTYAYKASAGAADPGVAATVGSDDKGAKKDPPKTEPTKAADGKPAATTPAPPKTPPGNPKPRK